jgi:hypothetical protein
MTTLAEIREFEDSIYELVHTDNWAEIEEKMDDAFLKLLVEFVESKIEIETCWSARVRGKACANAHLAAIKRNEKAGEAVRLAFLGECGVQEEEQKQQELLAAWGRAARAGLV